MVSKDDFDRFEDHYFDSKGKIDDRIDEILDDHEDFASKRRLLAHSVVGGKRVRPVLTMLAADVYETPYDKALNHAAIVELIHNASLVSDDMVDGDEERRGSSTVWKMIDKLPMSGVGRKATTGYTVLTQNGLLALALELAEDPDVVQAMGDSVMKLTDGFFLEGREVFAGLLGGGYDRYIEINKAKTGGLFALSTWMPAAYADVDEEYVDAARKYGETVGILYQITDDWVDGDLPSFIKDYNEELEKWYDEAVEHIDRMPEGGDKALLRAAPAFMVYKMAEQEGMADDLDVWFVPDMSAGEGGDTVEAEGG